MKFKIGNKVRVKKLFEKEFKKIHKKWGVPYEVYTEQYKKYFGKYSNKIGKIEIIYKNISTHCYRVIFENNDSLNFFEEELIEINKPYKRIIKNLIKQGESK